MKKNRMLLQLIISAKNEFKYNEIPKYILELPILKNSIPKI